MPDREKVAKGLERCKEGGSCDGCQYDINSSKCIFLLHADALSLLKDLEHKDKMFHALEDDWKRLNELLKEQEAVVQCKDCKYNDDGECIIKAGWFPVKPDWFCADGERRLDDG